MRFVFTICSLLICFVASANVLDSLRAEQRDEGLFVIHQVEEEETIYSIARRYGSSVQSIIKFNQITDNRIEIGQIIEVLVESDKTEKPTKVIQSGNENIHLVQPGETLYSISKKYDVKLKELRKWNNLDDNSITPGMQLKLAENATVPPTDEVNTAAVTPENIQPVDTVANDSLVEDPYAGFGKYLVQTGETLFSIAGKTGVSVDSLRIWNQLDSDHLKIGHELYYRGDKTDSLIAISQKSKTIIDDKGFERIIEVGVTSVIESMSTKRYLALHRTLPIGTNLEVRNLMNNQIVHVKVVGKLPDTGLNKNLLLRLSQPAYDQLGILDPKSRVEVSYHKQ